MNEERKNAEHIVVVVLILEKESILNCINSKHSSIMHIKLNGSLRKKKMIHSFILKTIRIRDYLKVESIS
jgi:hypothetical protein